jgi:hypothetical protein
MNLKSGMMRSSDKDVLLSAARHYVYTHRDANGAVRYIGAGCDSRAWSISSRSPAHSAWLYKQSAERGPGACVRIEVFNLLPRVATDIEAQLICDAFDAGVDLFNLVGGRLSLAVRQHLSSRQQRASWWKRKKALEG